MFKNLLLTLAEPGSEGGSGGGGEPLATGIPPLPSASARERIYDHADAAPNSESSGEKAPTAPAADPATPPASPDSAKAGDAPAAPAKGAEGTPDPVAEKRVKDAQAALTKANQALAEERKKVAEAQGKVTLYEKYVDPVKIVEHDKTEVEKELDQPLTKRDLASLKPASPTAEQPPDTPSTLDAPTREKFLSDYYATNAHVLPYAQSGEAYGVFLKEAERLGPEISGLSELDQLSKIGDAVATHFRARDAAKEKEIADRLNKKRTDISAGGLPPSGGAPGTGEAEDPGDDPSAEFAHRNAVRNRVLRPTI